MSVVLLQLFERIPFMKAKSRSHLKYISEKLKAKGEQVKGDIEQTSGQGVKGGFTKVKEKAMEAKADIEKNLTDKQN